MIETESIRWVQRFRSYQMALSELGEAVELAETRQLSKLESQGLIQAFEFTHELAWKVLKDYLEHRAGAHLMGSKDSTKAAFKANVLQDGELWMKMIEDRNLSVHTYSESIARDVADHVTKDYYQEFRDLEKLLACEISNE